MVRVRFAPSPTGVLHIGSARTALFNWFYAKRHGGSFVLRVEDTDIERSTAESELKLIDSLKRLGLGWDEGPDIGGDFGPYRQSERLSLYIDACKRLVESGAAYPCYCSAEELETERKAQAAAKKPPRYSGKCKELTDDERDALEKSGIKPSYRFRVEGGEVAFNDGVRGDVKFRAHDIGDFIIVRSDGVASYFLASAFDDMAMKITDVIRGEDHLSNTPKQILLIKAMGGEPPNYAHLPVILGDDGLKLSKRSGAADLTGLLDAGYLPGAVNTAMAMLGWSKVNGGEVETLDGMAQKFALADVSRAPSRFDEKRLDHINSLALKALGVEELFTALDPQLGKLMPAGININNEAKSQIVEAIHDALSNPKDAAEQVAQFAARLEPDEAAREVMTRPESGAVVDALTGALETATSQDFKAVVQSVSATTGLKGKKLYEPIRAAVTGRTGGPQLADLFTILGPSEIIERLKSIK